MKPLTLGIINWFGKDNVGSSQVVDFLTKHKADLVYQPWLSNMLSALKWMVVHWLYKVDKAIFALIPKAFNVKALFKDAGVTNLKADLLSGGLITALLAISLIWYFVKKQFFPNESADLKAAITHLIVAIILITSTGVLVDKALELSEGVFNEATQTEEGSLPFKLIKDNTLDIFDLAKNGWRTTNIVTTDPSGNQKVTTNENALTEDSFDSTDMNFVITPDVIDDIQDSDDLSKNVKKTLKDNLIYRLDHNETNDAVARKIDDGDPVNNVYLPGYARFVAPGYVLILGLISLGIAAFFILYTILETILQLVISSILANLVYATDIETGQRTKAVVTDLINSAAVIGFTGVEYDFYTIGITWAGKNIDTPLLEIMMLIALTMLLMFGSNSVLKYFNVDTAIKNNGNGLFKTVMAGNMAANTVSKVANNVSGVASGAKNAFQGALNAIRGNSSGSGENGSGGMNRLSKNTDLSEFSNRRNRNHSDSDTDNSTRSNLDNESSSKSQSNSDSSSSNLNKSENTDDSTNHGLAGNADLKGTSLNDNDGDSNSNNNNPVINNNDNINDNNNSTSPDSPDGDINSPNVNTDSNANINDVGNHKDQNDELNHLPGNDTKIADLSENGSTVNDFNSSDLNANSDLNQQSQQTKENLDSHTLGGDDRSKIADNADLTEDNAETLSSDIGSNLESKNKIQDVINNSNDATSAQLNQSFADIRKQNEEDLNRE